MTTRGATKAARLMTLIEQLEGAACSVAELARHAGVGKRTIQRDLQELEDLGYELEQRDRRYTLRVASTSLNPVEALAVHSATRLLIHHTRVNERHDRSALTKLAATLPDPARRYLLTSVESIERLSSEGSRTLDHVVQAWFEQRVLRVHYTAPIGSRRPRPRQAPPHDPQRRGGRHLHPGGREVRDRGARRADPGLKGSVAHTFERNTP